MKDYLYFGIAAVVLNTALATINFLDEQYFTAGLQIVTSIIVTYVVGCRWLDSND